MRDRETRDGAELRGWKERKGGQMRWISTVSNQLRQIFGVMELGRMKECHEGE